MNKHIELLRESVGVLARNSRFVVLFVVSMATVSAIVGLKSVPVILMPVFFVWLMYALGGVLGTIKEDIQNNRLASPGDFHVNGKKYFWRITGATALLFILFLFVTIVAYIFMRAGAFTIA